MIISSSEKKVMEKVAAELWESITERAEKRNIEIGNNVLIDPGEIEEKFDINPQKPHFSFDWQKGKNDYAMSKHFVSREKLEKTQRDFIHYLEKSKRKEDC